MKESFSVPQKDQICTKNLRLIPHLPPGPNLTVSFWSLSLWWTLLLDLALFPFDSVYSSYRTVQVAPVNHVQSMRWNSSATAVFIRESNTLNSLWSGHNLPFLFYLLLLSKSMPQSDGTAHGLQVYAKFLDTLTPRKCLVLFCMFSCSFTVPPKTTFLHQK